MENNSLQNDRLPFGNTKLFTGIISIVLSPLLVGFIFGVISVYLVDKDKQMLKQFPNNYNQDAVKNHKNGLLISWIGFIVSVVVAAVVLYFFGKYGTLSPEKIQLLKQ
jgi:Na+-driven multidrug efflux pump